MVILYLYIWIDSKLVCMCYKVIQRFEVTCFIAGQIITKGQSTITDVLLSRECTYHSKLYRDYLFKNQEDH